ncbi:hypothetical protein DEJ23_06605 [Curtobacterium sp. MCSS17_008]|uniref:DUF6518 family protein n=1 Tax=Curtobacterium sp. MCSS17_008 TaxID=2175647 RepID=UPI000DAA4B08|nr:DUF6518 family protein [Curtobacterium sp. MCSS17_008]PZF57804.1 hypothetical protein DEJ23_06605 [Curtobacterium sp. MCSS17_008]
MTPTVATHRPVPASAHRPVPRAVRISIALTASVLVGVLTSFGQAVPALAAAANAAGPWFVVAVALCALAGVRTGRAGLALAAVLGVASLELMHLGYWAATNLRGHPDVLSITNFWVLMGLPAGVLAGAVAVGLRTRDDRWRAAALGVAAAILVGEGVRAVLQVADDATRPGWVAQIVVGVAVLVVATVTARTPVARVVALGTGIVGAVGVLGAYLLIGG